VKSAKKRASGTGEIPGAVAGAKSDGRLAGEEGSWPAANNCLPRPPKTWRARSAGSSLWPAIRMINDGHHRSLQAASSVGTNGVVGALIAEIKTELQKKARVTLRRGIFLVTRKAGPGCARTQPSRWTAIVKCGITRPASSTAETLAGGVCPRTSANGTRPIFFGGRDCRS